jgi:threonine-phosphate decarboxylase
VNTEHVEAADSAPVHGGDVLAIGGRYGVDPASLLDFSVNVNPAGPPPALLRALEAGVRDVAALGRYPEPDARGLRLALSAHLDVEPDAIVVANGAAAVISTSLATLAPRRCLVPTPAFSEYRHAVRAVGAEWCAVPLDSRIDFALDPQRVSAALREQAADVCIIANPHNPSGAIADRDAVLFLAAAGRRQGAATIVDEAFIDYAPAGSVTRDAAITPHLIAVRSLTKFFGVPSLRVGYAVAHPDLARRMRAQLPSWPVTTLAMVALTAALADLVYAQRTITENAHARGALADDLRGLGLHVGPSAANFLLVRLPAGSPCAAELVERLILDHSIVVRDCSSYEGLANGGYVRVGVRERPDNLRLVRALSSALGRGGTCPQ